MANLLEYIVIVYPSLRSSLWTFRRTIKGWKQLTLAQSAMRMTKRFLLAFVHHLISRSHVVAAVALAVQWGCYLRGSKVLHLCRHHVALPGDARVSRFRKMFPGINIKDAKTEPLQFTVIRDHDVLLLLQTYLKSSCITGSQPLFPISYQLYQSLIKDTALFFGLFGRFTTHSARLGGAFHDYCMGVSAETIAITGRWVSLPSLEKYLQNARAWILEMPTSCDSDNAVERSTSHCCAFLKKCPVYLDTCLRWQQNPLQQNCLL